jgi:hypothetical protein
MTAPTLSLVIVVGDPRTNHAALASQVRRLEGVRVTLVTRVTPAAELVDACDQVVVLPHAVPPAKPKPPPPTPEEREALEAAAAEAAAAAAARPMPTGAKRVQAAVTWRSRRAVLGAKRRAAPTARRARLLREAIGIDRAIRADHDLEHRVASADVVCAVDTTATAAVWQLGQRHTEPAVVQGFAAVDRALNLAARGQ